MAAKLSGNKIGKILARHRIIWFNTEQVLAILRAPSLRLTPAAAEAGIEHVLCYCLEFHSWISKSAMWNADLRGS
jgi:hypothetical protein